MNRFRVREMSFCAALAGSLCSSSAMAQLLLDVEVTPAGAGVVATFPGGESFELGEWITITATPAEGYEFTGWEGDISALESTMTFEMTSDTSLRAVFTETAPPQYRLTAYADPSGAGTLVRDPADFTYAEGAEVTITAYPGQGYAFGGWTGDLPDDADPANPTLVLTMDADRDVLATFLPAQTLDDETGANPPGGAACGAIGVVGMGLMFSMMLMLRFGRAVR